MRIVRDESGKEYVLLERSDDGSRVRDPETGTECVVENDRFEPIEGASPLETIAAGVSKPVRRITTAVHDDRSLGMLIDLVDRGPLAVRTLLDVDDFCESDLHGLLGEFRAAGLVTEVSVAGERGYDATDLARDGVAVIRSGGD
ncbi:MAG: hypothetical protein ACI9PP_000616 [Halobacteriales archaeon]|jgi:hypothetical protein